MATLNTISALSLGSYMACYGARTYLISNNLTMTNHYVDTEHDL